MRISVRKLIVGDVDFFLDHAFAGIGADAAGAALDLCVMDDLALVTGSAGTVE